MEAFGLVGVKERSLKLVVVMEASFVDYLVSDG